MFRFKQFTIRQDNCAMKVGTDGCLLGAWANLPKEGNILDIGCGSGLLSIMAAQRSNAKITGIEIDSGAAKQAFENVSESPWSNRIEIINCDIIDYNGEDIFDAIISNPPFFQNSLKCPDKARTAARHDDSLSCNELMQCAKRLLVPGGTLSIVIPRDLLNTWCDEALFKGLLPRRITDVRTLPHKQAKRSLVEFVKGVHSIPETSEMTLEEKPGIYSIEAKRLLRDFYLKIE